MASNNHPSSSYLANSQKTQDFLKSQFKYYCFLNHGMYEWNLNALLTLSFSFELPILKCLHAS